MTNAPTLQVAAFGGLNNKDDPQSFGLRAMLTADNVNINGRGVLTARRGRTALSTDAYRGAFATPDGRRCYAVAADGALEQWPGDAALELATGFIGYPYWTQIADVVFVGNEYQTWRIGADHRASVNGLAQPEPLRLSAVGGTLPAGQYRFVQVSVVDGRESAPSEESIITLVDNQSVAVGGITGQRIYVCPTDSTAFGWWRDTVATALVYADRADMLGEELSSVGLQPMPDGRCLAAYQGRLYCAIYDQRSDRTGVYRSFGNWWDLCDTQDFKWIPGEVRAMAGHPEGLLIGTDRNLWALVDDVLTRLTDYGVPPGQAIAKDAHGQLGIVTRRGFCSAFPFAEITPQFDLPDADWTGTAFVREDGAVRLVATISPFGDPDNART